MTTKNRFYLNYFSIRKLLVTSAIENSKLKNTSGVNKLRLDVILIPVLVRRLHVHDSSVHFFSPCCE